MCPILLLRHGVTESASSSLARLFSRIVETMLTDHTAICENSYVSTSLLVLYFFTTLMEASLVAQLVKNLRAVQETQV